MGVVDYSKHSLQHLLPKWCQYHNHPYCRPHKKSLWWMIVTKLCRQDFAFLNNLEIHLQELYRNQFERGPHTARRHNLLSIEGKIYILASPCLRWPPTLSNLVACSSKMVVVLFVKKKSFCSKHGSDQLDISQLWNMERHLWHSLSKSFQWNVIVIHQAAFLIY